MAALLGSLELLARRDYAGLRKICAVDDDDLVDMIAEIKRLNPKPGLAFGSVAHGVTVPAGRAAHRAPLRADGKSRAAAAAQARSLQFRDRRLGTELLRSGQTAAATYCEPFVE